MVKDGELIYEISYGHDSHGEVRLVDGEYHCYTIPLFGGEWIWETKFDNEDDAIDFINSIS